MTNPDAREKRTLSPSGHEGHTKKQIFTDCTQTVVGSNHRVSIRYRNMTITTAHPAPARLESTQFQQNKTPETLQTLKCTSRRTGETSDNQ
ncbi:hypothetical protein AVEN_137458-1 [Araneus ventricosus]|uniref:Uncharacterized protein n=1 Tax=Araneus ventricosus TaxID=182803 RepID=A0A4Y2LZ63_ARAVE|nr:hypothetical protein AVEN_137458-1 [Araneus ventricosus]